MKIFAIRKQNGETVIISATNQEEAIKAAGLTMESVLEVADQLRQQAHEIAPAALMREGIGPQPYEIRELQDFQLTMKLDHLGEFELADIGCQTHEQLSELYPILNAAIEEACNRWSAHPMLPESEKPVYRRLLRAAAEQERNRLCTAINLADLDLKTSSVM
jgi:hypothetical protein